MEAQRSRGEYHPIACCPIPLVAQEYQGEVYSAQGSMMPECLAFALLPYSCLNIDRFQT